MKIHAVMIKDGFGNRWIDSLWLFKLGLRSAESRKADLLSIFAAMDAKHTAWIVALELEDAALESVGSGRLADRANAEQSLPAEEALESANA